MRIFISFSMFVTLLFPFIASADQLSAQLDRINQEKTKIQNYISDGQSSPALKTELAKLEKQKQSVLAKIKAQSQKQPKAKIVKKSTPIIKKKKAKITRKSRPAYSVNTELPIGEQYAVVLRDLEKEQETLQGLQTSLRRGVAASYLTKPIQESRNKISSIELVKTKIERKIAQAKKDSFDTNLKVGAMLDFYYLYSPERAQEGTDISPRNYDRKSNDFTLNLLEINVAATLGKVDIYADLDFGDFADQNSSESGDPANHNIGQAYLTYNFSDKFSVSAGKMYTHVGYEVAKAMDNWNYSRSFAFSLGGPFWHEGVAARYDLGGGYSTALFVYDGWDHTTEINSNKTTGLQLGYANDKFHFLFNLATGGETAGSSNVKSVYEFNTQYAFSDQLSVALNGVIGKDEEALTPEAGSTSAVDQEWQAVVVYLNWQANEKWSFTPRFEIFKDASDDNSSGGTLLGTAEEVQSVTLTSTYHESDNTQFRIEVRNDKADEDNWLDEDNEGVDSLSTLSFSWLTKI